MLSQELWKWKEEGGLVVWWSDVALRALWIMRVGFNDMLWVMHAVWPALYCMLNLLFSFHFHPLFKCLCECRFVHSMFFTHGVLNWKMLLRGRSWGNRGQSRTYTQYITWDSRLLCEHIVFYNRYDKFLSTLQNVPKTLETVSTTSVCVGYTITWCKCNSFTLLSHPERKWPVQGAFTV